MTMSLTEEATAQADTRGGAARVRRSRSAGADFAPPIAARPAGVGRAQPRHGAGLHPGPTADGAGAPAFRRARPLAAGAHGRRLGRPEPGGRRVEPEATVFTNIAPGSADVVRPWVDALRNVGFAVFAKPKIDEDSDVDRDMLDHIERGAPRGLRRWWWPPRTVRRFVNRWKRWLAHGIPVQVIGFREHASWALASDTLDFVDLEDIAGVFREPLPRIGLDSLPDQGAWLQPFRPLSALLTSRV